MLLDHSQRGWALASLAIFVTSLVLYVLYAWSDPRDPRGGSAIGLVFGVIGFGFMIFAAAFGARERVPTWGIGRAQLGLRGHLWLVVVSLPLIFFYLGFHFGG